MKALSLINSKWYKVIDNVTWILAAILSCLILFQVINRFILHITVPWTEEFCRYCFVWLTMAGSSKAVYDRQHIAVDILPALFEGKFFIKIFNIIMSTLVLFFFMVMFVQCVRFCQQSIGTYCVTVRIPVLYVYLILPVGFFSMFLFQVEVSAQDIKKNFFTKTPGGEQA